MELKSNVRALNYVKKLLLGDTKNMLPFPVRVQKPAPEQSPCVPLPRSTPDAEGVPAAALDKFYRALAAAEHVGAHHTLVLRHGKVIAEGHFAPYEAQYFHATHSLCKSFTGTAVGMLIDEGKLSMDELVCNILPDKCSLLTSKKMRTLTVKHLVTMRSGVNFREMGCILEKDWASAFLASDLSFDPGTQFSYNSMNSYMLSAIVTRKTGKPMVEYLREKLFEPMGFGSVAWQSCPMGNTKGGWGMYVMPEDCAKLALLYLNKGVWNGRRLLSEEWIDAATKADSVHENGEEYGYQMWTHTEDASFMFNGMFGQYVASLPQLDMVVVVNAGSGNFFTYGPTWTALRTLVDDVSAADADGFTHSSRRDSDALAFTLSHLRFGEAVPQYAGAERVHWLERFWPRTAKKRAADAAPQLPAEAAQILKLHYNAPAAPANRVSILPFVTSVMNDYYSKGLDHIAFALHSNVLCLLWTEGGGTQCIPIGFGHSEKGELNMGGNRFVIATEGRFVHDEDDNLVLKLTVNMLEETSSQYIKLFFLPDQLLVRLAEAPSILFVSKLMDGTNPGFLQMNAGIFKNNDLLQHCLNKIFYPTLRLSHAEEEASAETAQPPAIAESISPEPLEAAPVEAASDASTDEASAPEPAPVTAASVAEPMPADNALAEKPQ